MQITTRFQKSYLLAGALMVAFLAPGTVLRAEEGLGQARHFRVRLTGPVSSDSTQGSKVVAQVVSPDAFAGDSLEGEVIEAKSSGHADKKSVLVFTFNKLYHGGQPIEISGQITRAYNSQGAANVDERGNIVSQDRGLLGDVGDTLKKVRIPWGGKNRDKAQTAIAAAALLISYSATADKISFDTGSEFELDVQQR